MTKSLKILTVLAVASVVGAPCAMAETLSVTAVVPFDFVVADRHLPSGEYRFVSGENPEVMTVYAAATREKVATVFCRPLSISDSERGTLVFDRYGSERFLKRVRTGGGSGLYVPETPYEAKTAQQSRVSGTAVAAR